MTGVRLAGCRSDTLIGYLKTLGVLRLCATQLEASLRAEWRDGEAILRGAPDAAAVESFFLKTYRPTPILNPWNSGAGFDAGSRATQGRPFTAIAETSDERFAPYRAALEVAESALREAEKQQFASEKQRKPWILAALRRNYPDEALEWLDAAVIMGGGDDLAFPPLLGTGGNDGRLDFSVNFASRLLEVIGPSKRGVDAKALLRDALYATGTGMLLADKAIGQYAPANAGGVNASTGFDAKSLVNPWDYILLMEGTLCFAASAARRFSGSLPYPVAPFTFRSAVAAGYPSASTGEKVRGELWLPRWSGAVTYGALRSLLRAGRLEINLSDDDRSGVRYAQTALEAAHAALSFGSTFGVERFQRILVAERNGLAYAAVAVGAVATAEDHGFGALSRDAIRWVGRLRAEELGQAARTAYRAYANAVFDYGNAASEHDAKARALQCVVAALGELDRTLALTLTREVTPIPFLHAGMMRYLDDGSPEHELARALCAVGMGQVQLRLRFNIANVLWSPDHRLKYARTADVLWAPSDLIGSLARIAERRARIVAENGQDRHAVTSDAAGAPAHVLADFVDGAIDLERLQRLIVGYSIIAPSAVAALSERERDDPKLRTTMPAALGALKLMIDGVAASAYLAPPPLDPTIIALLNVRRPRAALFRLYHRLRSSGFSPRAFYDAAVDGPRYAAAALFPLNTSARYTARQSATRSMRAFKREIVSRG